MSKKSLIQEIVNRVKRKKDLKEEIASRKHNVEEFAMKFINDMEDMIASTANTSLLASLAPLYAKSFEERIKAIDPGCAVTVQWLEGSSSDPIPRINGILINWSKEYQVANSCEEQLFIDVTSLLFK